MQNESKKSWAVEAAVSAAGGVIARYREYLSVGQGTPVVTLGEGSTPLVFAPRLSERIGGRVFIKCEGLNPTGSFKDRGMTVAVSKAVGRGAHGLICASTGNTSASAAAYAARAGIRCAVILPVGKIASGKLVQAIAHGARIISIDGNFDDALRIVRELGDNGEFAIVNSINPDRIAGQKTGAFEVVDELGEAPDVHILPLGNAGNLTAYAAGYSEYRQLGKARVMPRMIGIQAEHAAPIFHRRIIERPETVAAAIRIGNPASWKAAQRAIDESHGAVEIVNDEEILEAQSWLAKTEGIFVEPASAAPVAGLFKLSNACDLISKDSTIVCTCTGHGLKDPEIVLAKFSSAAPVAPTIEAVREAITSE
ncbi:MAG TPA: threonine synthase [Chthoniobacterales bacterium]|nr:threonine synthase [Chthoniobacterales bacterium]